MWGNLIPLIIGSAVVPVQIVITLLLLRSTAGRITAVAWIVGMTAARLLQGVLFGLVIANDGADGTAGGPGLIVSTLLLVVGVLFVLTALKALLHEEDSDAPPPKWLTMTETMTPLRAGLFGAGLIAVGAKFWVLTLSAIAVISAADLGRSSSVLTFLAFVVLAESVMIAAVAVSYLAPQRSAASLERASTWLTDHNRTLVVILGAGFGTWFLAKALSGFGIL